MTNTDRAARKAAAKASADRMAAARAATQAAVDAGCCPDCGSGLKRNSSIAGWWQCAQYGAVGFRADAAKPACNWQGFTA